MVNDIEWYGPDRGKGSVEDIVSHMDPVRHEVGRKASSMASQASALLGARSGDWKRSANPRIVLQKAPPRKLDWWILLEADTRVRPGVDASEVDASSAALGIEFGYTRSRGAYGGNAASGLHILGRVVASNVGSFGGG